MSSHLLKALTLGATLALGAGGTWAQVTAPANQPVTTIGVTLEDAKEATKKAQPAEDTGTLVQTDASIAERAKDASKEAKKAITPDSSKPAAKKPSTDKKAKPKAPAKATSKEVSPNPNDAISGTTLLEEEASPPKTGRPAPETNTKASPPVSADQK